MKKILKNIALKVLGESTYMKLWKLIIQNPKNKKREKEIQEKNESSILEFVHESGPKIFIETGTYRGDMVNRVSKRFEKIYSIELSSDLWAKAQKRFASMKHIEILQGDSTHVLPQILAKIDKPALFWLDAHFSTGETARGDLDTPIEEELRTILNHRIKNHIILIDDAREFVGKNGYPPLANIKKMASEKGYSFDVQKDNIRLFSLSNNI
jgi:hypothetical protein